MKPNFTGLANFFDQIDTNIESTFVFEGQEYGIEQFNIEFSQSVDFKGQPQSETKGGQISLTLTQAIPDGIYDWAKKTNKPKEGKILFKSKTEGTILEVGFSNANCIKLDRKINYLTGTRTTLVIAPEKITMNGFSHDNKWRK